MNEQRVLELIEKVGNIASAREAIDAIFTALKTFEGESHRYNRHLAIPSPAPTEWKLFYAQVEPYAEELARVLAAHRDSFSLNLTNGLDGAAGLIDAAAAYGVETPSILKQFNVQEAVSTVERIASKLNVFLYSWGRPSLAQYRGEQMKQAVDHASYIVREASYFVSYLARLLNKRMVDDKSDGR